MSATPLAGLLVVDLTRLLPGPLAARLLADLGARVVKVEEPRLGDPVRLAPPLRGGESVLGSLLLAGVESVALDLKNPEARGVLFALLERADVLLDSFRPGGLARLGLPPELLVDRFPPVLQRAAVVFGILVVIGFGWLLVQQGWKLVELGQFQQTAVMGLSKQYIYLSVPVGGALIILFSLGHLWRALRGVPATGGH